MSESERPHYSAFLSYAHADGATANWLFQAMESFPIGKDLAGRSNATINFTMFVAAFASQYLVGFIIGLFPASGTGYSPDGYSWAIGIFLVAQLLAFGWYLAASPHRETRA